MEILKKSPSILSLLSISMSLCSYASSNSNAFSVEGGTKNETLAPMAGLVRSSFFTGKFNISIYLPTPISGLRAGVGLAHTKFGGPRAWEGFSGAEYDLSFSPHWGGYLRVEAGYLHGYESENRSYQMFATNSAGLYFQPFYATRVSVGPTVRADFPSRNVTYRVYPELGFSLLLAPWG